MYRWFFESWTISRQTMVVCHHTMIIRLIPKGYPSNRMAQLMRSAPPCRSIQDNFVWEIPTLSKTWYIFLWFWSSHTENESNGISGWWQLFPYVSAMVNLYFVVAMAHINLVPKAWSWEPRLLAAIENHTCPSGALWHSICVAHGGWLMHKIPEWNKHDEYSARCSVLSPGREGTSLNKDRQRNTILKFPGSKNSWLKWHFEHVQNR